MITPLDQALAQVRAKAVPLPAEDVPLAEAHGRVLAEAVRARRDQPATDISMMDGYALRAGDAGAAVVVIGEGAAGGAAPAPAPASGPARPRVSAAPPPPRRP